MRHMLVTTNGRQRFAVGQPEADLLGDFSLVAGRATDALRLGDGVAHGSECSSIQRMSRKRIVSDRSPESMTERRMKSMKSRMRLGMAVGDGRSGKHDL